MRWFLLLALVFGGCASKSYLLPAPKDVRPLASIQKRIGVTVEVSEYLLLGKVAYKRGNTLYFDEEVELAEDSRSFLQKSLIEYLKKSLQDPYVYAFPWEVEQMPECVVRLEVKDMYVDEEEREGVAHVELMINDHLENLTIKTPWRGDRISTMYGLYEAVLERVATEVSRSCR
ncbi:MAG: hypothetical protein C6H99_04180 [Epsilonproteobacteria bacterium]|nr:hypothetical protein [Campylobacterota bacterium]NPA64975.1 hypothetical protein [Campylobacterota bacterium]